MANTTETVFIEFVVQGDDIQSTTEVLERTGQIDKQAAEQFKKTNAELAKRQKTIDGLNKQLRETQAQNAKTIADLQAKTETFVKDFVEGFSEGIVETLQEAGFEFDEFGKIISKNDQTIKKAGKSLKGELRAITQELAAMKLRGEDNTQQYEELAQKAGEMRDAIGDASNEVKNFASDTSNIDGLISLTQGVAGGFAIAEGAQGLFGASSEELNETLLRVSSTMALLQGLQQVGNVLQKESAAGTFIMTAAQKTYNVVVGESVGVMAAFRVALASTGIGLLIVGIIAMMEALKKTNKETENANRLLERNKNIIEADTAAIKRNTEEQIARAEAVNEKESEIIKLRGHSLSLQRKAVLEANADLAAQRNQLDATSEAYFKLNQQIDDNNELIKDIDSQLIIEQINLDRQLRTERLQSVADGLQAQLDGAQKNTKRELELAKSTARAKAAIDLNEAGSNLERRLAIEAALQKQIRELDLNFSRVRQQDKVSAAERELLAAQQASRAINARTNQEEIDAQKKVIQETARLELLETGLTENQKLQIQEKALADQLQLQKEFNKEANANALEDYISRKNVELSNIKLTNKEREQLQEEALIAQAQLEIEANEGLTDKILEIRAKLNEDLRALRLAALQKELNDELSLEASRTGAIRRASERMAENENIGLQKRINAINQLAALDIAAVNSRQDALEKSLEKGLISQEEFNVQYEALKDEELEIYENAELRKQELSLATTKANIALALESAQTALNIINQFGQQQTEAEQARIDAQRAEVDELREAGAITEKEALARQKKLDQEERTLKRKQAERDKAVALFSAIINTAAAVVKALPNLVLAGIAAALGLAQIALIASKPIPKFGKGKKGNYEGPAEIGETGAELVESEGRMYIAKKKTFVWLGKQDKVYNPSETAAMLEKNNMQPYVIKDDITKEYHTVTTGAQIDYDKLGKVISENIPQMGLDISENGITMIVRHNNSIIKYLDDRRSYR